MALLGQQFPMQESNTKAVSANEYIPPTIREQLVGFRDQFLAKAAAIDATLKAMDSNPGFEQVHDAVNRLGLGIR